MKWWLLVIIVVVALLLFTVREGFEATDTIKNPNTWNAVELTRIRGMLGKDTTLTDAELQTYVGGFWNVWSDATIQITESDLTRYMNSITPPADKANDVKTLVRKYFIEQGQSMFQSGRGYISQQGSTYAITDQIAKLLSKRNEAKEFKIPKVDDPILRNLVKTKIGVPDAKDSRIDSIILNLINYYYEVYTPTKQIPTANSVKTFVDKTTLGDADKAALEWVIQSYFTDNAFVKVSYVGDLYKTPSPDDNEIRAEVAGSAGVSTSNAMIDTIIGELIKFHATLASKTDPPTPAEITSFVDLSTLDARYKPSLKGLIDWYYSKPSHLNTGINQDMAAGQLGDRSSSSYQPGGGPDGLESKEKGRNIWGPAFTGFGTPIYDAGEGTGAVNYPTISGPDQIQPTKPEESAFGRTFIPSSASLGSLGLSKFLPFSRTNTKDIGLATDPYRTSSSYSTSSYSSKPEPVPFLTDFSVFMK